LALESQNGTLLQALLYRRTLPQSSMRTAVKLGPMRPIPRKTRTDNLP
jgi:hypothetical protein